MGAPTAKASELATLSKDELVSKARSMTASLRRIREKAKAPIKQFSCTAAGWGGGAISGLTHYYLPEVMGVPVDGAVGVLISLGALTASGNDLADASAVFGVGLAAPAISRGVEGVMRTHAAAAKKK